MSTFPQIRFGRAPATSLQSFSTRRLVQYFNNRQDFTQFDFEPGAGRGNSELEVVDVIFEAFKHSSQAYLSRECKTCTPTPVCSLAERHLEGFGGHIEACEAIPSTL